MPDLHRIQFSGFEPSSEQILAQFSPPPPDHEIEASELSPFLRALLEIDGTVTRFIEAYAMEPVSVLKLGQGELTLTHPVDFLDLKEGDRVTTRQVLLWGERTRRIYLYGSSLIVPERMLAEARQALQRPNEGLGVILRRTRMETFREVLWRYREYSHVLPEAIRPLAEEGLVSRTYRIIHGGRPIMAINEKFPLSPKL